MIIKLRDKDQSYLDGALPDADILHGKVFTPVPYALHHLTIGIVHHSVAVHFASVELALVYLVVVPFEYSVPMHLSVLKWASVLPSFGPHFAMSYFQVARKLTDVLALPVLHV